MPADWKATYGKIVTNFWPQKDDPYQTRLNVRENLIDYPGELRITTTDMLNSKLMSNRTI